MSGASYGEAGLDWVDPVDFVSPQIGAVRPLQRFHVPEAIFEWAEDTARRIGVPAEATALAALAVCSSVIHEEWKVQVRRHDTDYKERARLWCVLLGSPGIAKTPVINEAIKPLEAIEFEARKIWQGEMAKYKEACDTIMIETKSKAAAAAMLPAAPKQPRYMVQEATIEALAKILSGEASSFVPTGKLLNHRDEMSTWIGGMGQYKSGDKSGDRGHWLTSYGGGQLRIDRSGPGSKFVPHFSTTLLAGIQPEPIKKIAQEMEDDGLIQRCLFAVIHGMNVAVDASPDYYAKKRYAQTVEWLARMRPYDETAWKQNIIKFSEGAHKWRDHIDKIVDVMLRMPNTSNHLKGTLNKAKGTFARLALTFHMIEIAYAKTRNKDWWDDAAFQQISEYTAKMTASYMKDIIIPHWQMADAEMYGSKTGGHAMWIAQYIMSQETPLYEITARQIKKDYKELATPEKEVELQTAMSELEVLGWVKQTKTIRTRPVTWSVNPKIYSEFATYAKAERERRNAEKERIAIMRQEIAAMAPT